MFTQQYPFADAYCLSAALEVNALADEDPSPYTETTLKDLDEVLTPSEATTVKLCVVSEEPTGAVPVICPVDEFIDAHTGKSVDE